MGGVAPARVLLCSRNEHKLRELRRALSGWEIGLLDVDGYPPETGVTFYENALAKARFGRPLAPADAWVLGEDSGLELSALGGAPGVETARWAQGRHVERALEALAGRSELVSLSPDGTEVRGTGVLDGEIATAPSGTAGFGFDPVFVPVGETATVAALGDDWKAEHSHRARAARALRAAISGR